MSIQADKMEAGEGNGWWEGAKENPLFTPKIGREEKHEASDSGTQRADDPHDAEHPQFVEEDVPEDAEEDEKQYCKCCCFRSFATVKVLERKTSSVVKEAKRRKSVVRVAVEAFEEKHETAFKVLGWAKSIVAEGLYFSDVTTDVLLCVTFYTFKHYGWFQIMLTFLILPNLVAMGGIAYYVCKEGIDWPLVATTGAQS